MDALRTIEIDFEVHKCIEMARLGFDETPNAVLRRLLKIPKNTSVKSSPPLKGKRPWTGKGVILPHGTALRMEYNGHIHTGAIEEGAWVVENKKYRSPSAAAGGVGRTKAGKPTSLDGWIYWHVRRPEDVAWLPLKELRKAAGKLT